jgi:hypothetical protein
MQRQCSRVFVFRVIRVFRGSYFLNNKTDPRIHTKHTKAPQNAETQKEIRRGREETKVEEINREKYRVESFRRAALRQATHPEL